jgi:hypothetical protein
VKRAALFLTIVFILLVAAGILLYLKFTQRETLSIWRIIPDHAVLVYESGNCETCLNQFKDNPIWLSVKEILVNHKVGDFNQKILNDITGNLNWFSSLHLVQRNNFDLIFYLSADFNSLTEGWLKSFRLAPSSREYSGFVIYEIKQNDQVFSWTIIENFWIGSFTSFLIEDVIRAYRSGGEQSFDSVTEGIRKLPVVRNDMGNLYIRLDKMNALFNSFLQESSSFLKVSAAHAAVFDIKPGASLNLSGFSLAEKEDSNSLLAYFSQQNPVAFSHKQLISNRALLVTNYGIDNGIAFFKNLPVTHDKRFQDSLRSLTSIDAEALFAALGNQISVCWLERKKLETAKMVLFDVSDKAVWLRAFDRLSRATERSDSLYVESYGVYEIRKIDLINLPGKLFGPLIQGFKQTYYVVSGNTFFLAENQTDIKRFLDDIDAEEVWGKSVSTNQFLESTLLESNISIFFNVPLAKNVLLQNLTPAWKKIFTSNPSILNRPGLGAIQFSNLNETFYTHLVLESSREGSSATATFQGRLQVNLRSSITSSLFSVRNHATKQNDVVFQDSLGMLQYYSPEGKLLWKVQLEGAMVGNIRQVDFFNNGKLQLFITTPGQLHVIDRLGNYVAPFPVSVPVQQPDFNNVIDYDNSKRYRFIISDGNGRVWLFDKQGQPLEGWKPKQADGKLVAEPRHYRIQGKDYIVAIRQDGYALIWNRKGEPVKGFPLWLDMRPSGSFYFEPGSDLSGSVFTCISRDGIKLKFTASGKLLNREPWVKSTVTDQFFLVKEKSDRGYLIVRQNAKRLTVFDDDGREVVANDFIGLNNVDVQYYDFGSGKIFIVLVDRDQDLCYLYDGNGNSLIPTPVEATSVLIGWDGRAILVYTNEKMLTIEPL